MATIDLHIHSNCSNDGDYAPAQLVQLCREAGLTHAAIADHNSTKGIAEAIKAAEGTGLVIIPAIEMNCVIDEVELHVLGYGIDHTAPIFIDIDIDLHQQEQDNSARLMHLVRQLGIDFDDDLIASLAYDGVVTGEMIAEAALIYDRDVKNPLLDPYRGEGMRSDNPYANFYWDYCSQGKPAYTPMTYAHLSEVIEIIQSNHGVPVLAHPGANVKEDSALLEKIIAQGIMGIEVYSSYHDHEQVRYYHQAAQSHQLLMTCGSDFHGKTKKNIRIGGIRCEGREKQILTELTHMIERA